MQVYKTHKKMQSIYEEQFGTWDDVHGLIDKRSSRILSKRRHDMMGQTVSIAIVVTNNDSLNHLTDYQ